MERQETSRFAKWAEDLAHLLNYKLQKRGLYYTEKGVISRRKKQNTKRPEIRLKEPQQLGKQGSQRQQTEPEKPQPQEIQVRKKPSFYLP